MDGRGKQSRRGGGIVCNLTKTLGFCWASSLGTSSETQGTTTGRKPLVKFKSTDMREKRQTNFLRTTTVVNSVWGEVLADCQQDQWRKAAKKSELDHVCQREQLLCQARCEGIELNLFP